MPRAIPRANKRRADCHPDRPHEALGMCRPCYAVHYSLTHPKRDRSASQQQRIETNRLKNTGWSVAEYEAASLVQGGACAICGQTQDRALAADHDHLTKTKRALLCHSCNVAIGFLRDSPELAEEIAAYIRRYR